MRAELSMLVQLFVSLFTMLLNWCCSITPCLVIDAAGLYYCIYTEPAINCNHTDVSGYCVTVLTAAGLLQLHQRTFKGD
uniref:Putative secreted protein n=1 Tax=Rhipicephalus microplus TaxID=6941 RepID=A0A6G5A2M8_RHIMP